MCPLALWGAPRRPPSLALWSCGESQPPAHGCTHRHPGAQCGQNHCRVLPPPASSLVSGNQPHLGTHGGCSRVSGRLPVWRPCRLLLPGHQGQRSLSRKVMLPRTSDFSPQHVEEGTTDGAAAGPGSGWEAGTSTESSPTRQAPPCAPVGLMVLTNEGGSSVSSSCRHEAREATCWGMGTLCVNLVQRSSRGLVRGSVSSGMSGGGRPGGSSAGGPLSPSPHPGPRGGRWAAGSPRHASAKRLTSKPDPVWR